MTRKQEKSQQPLDAAVVKEALRWVHENKGLTVGKEKYSSPRISSEIGDCSMPLTFDHYNFCALGCNYCVVPGTLISAPGKRLSIEEISVGDKVYSYNVEKDCVELDEVISTMKRKTEELLKMELENGQVLFLTPNHPIYIDGKGWIPAGEVSIDDDVIFIKNAGASFSMRKSNPMKNEKTAAKMAKSLKASFASGKLEGLRKKLSIAASRNITKYNKSEVCRNRVSARMKKNNPMHDSDVREKNRQTWKRRLQSGKIVPYWLGRKKPDATERMSGPGNPMKDPDIRRRTLQKIVKSWIENGKISEGEIHVKSALEFLGVDFVHQSVIPGPNREFIMDFFLPNERVCIEYDGHSKHYTRKGIEFDKNRDRFLSDEYDIQTLRIHRDQAFIPQVALANHIRKSVAI